MPTHAEITETATIPAPVSHVWDLISATDRYAEWVDAVLEVTDHHGPAQVGRTYSERNAVLGPIPVRSTWTVVENEPRRRVDTGTGFPLIKDLVNVFELQPVDAPDGTEHTDMTYRVRYRIGLGPLGRLIDKLQQGGVRAGQRRSMANLSDLLSVDNEATT